MDSTTGIGFHKKKNKVEQQFGQYSDDRELNCTFEEYALLPTISATQQLLHIGLFAEATCIKGFWTSHM